VRCPRLSAGRPIPAVSSLSALWQLDNLGRRGRAGIQRRGNAARHRVGCRAHFTDDQRAIGIKRAEPHWTAGSGPKRCPVATVPNAIRTVIEPGAVNADQLAVEGVDACHHRRPMRAVQAPQCGTQRSDGGTGIVMPRLAR